MRQEIGNQNYKKLAEGVNQAIGTSLDAFKEVIIDKSNADGWPDDDRLRSILTSTNIDWEHDLLPETVTHLSENNLMGYLEW